MQTTVKRSASEEPDISKDNFVATYRWMLLARIAEEKFASLYRGGKIFGGVFLGKGQEAVSAATGQALRKTDLFAPLIRDQAGRLAFGEPLLDAMRTYLGSKLGPMRGRDGNVHRGRPREGLFAMISHLGAMLPVVSGALMARRFQGITDCVGATCIGEGGTSTGAFHEGLNAAAVEKLPLVVVVTNNQYSYSTPNDRQFACKDLVDRAIGYGVDGYHLDGTRLDQCLEIIPTAIERARAGHGPQLIIASILRLAGHGEHDDASYISEEMKRSPMGADCLQLATEHLLEEMWATDSEIADWREAASLEVEEALAIVQREAPPSPEDEDWCAISTDRLRDGFLGEV